MGEEINRPDPDQLLLQVEQMEETGTGKLKVFFGYAAGVGKTYAMLKAAKKQSALGKQVVLGYIEPHVRPDTLALIEGFESIPTKKLHYKNMQLEEFDLDAALALSPDMILVDELAHTNVIGSRNKKRYQDIEELLRAGIDVFTTVNVQHLESLNDIIEEISQIRVQETVPDSFLSHAEIKLIDIEPEELLSRLKEGKIYRPERARKAMNHFFIKENLKLLREIAIRKAADHISMDNRIEDVHKEKRVHVRLLTCIHNLHHQGAEKCIRWTARLANAFHGEWVVLSVEKSDEESTEEEQNKLKENMALAERLGAEVVTLVGDHPIEVITQYAKLTSVTDIIVGKYRHRFGHFKWLKSDIEDELMKRLNHVELHIIPLAEKEPHRQKGKASLRQLIPKKISVMDLLKTVGLLVGATLLSEVVTYLGIGDQNVIIVYLLFVVMISRLTTGYFYGILGSGISVILFNWFFVEPLNSLTVYKPGYPITLLIMLIGALFTSNMMIRLKNQARDSIEKEHQMEVLYDLNKSLLSTRNLTKIVQLTNAYLVQAIERSVIFYTEKPHAHQTLHILTYQNKEDYQALASGDEQGVANWVFNNHKIAGFGTDTLMGAKGHYFPVISQGNVLAVIGILVDKKHPLTYEQQNFLKMLTSQLSLALERQRLAAEQQQIMVENEKEKMRGNLLRAISHDLRTPLTGILGASSVLLEDDQQLPSELKKSLLTDMKEDAEWLIRMVENLLSVTRIDEGTMKVKKTPEAVEEVVGAAVGKIRKRFKGQDLVVKVPDDLLLIPMDGTLIEQVLINLIENAIKHARSKEPVMITVKKKPDFAIFEVSDDGIGITKERVPVLFQQLGEARDDVPIDSSRGMGIGLSICKTIVTAHGGTIEAVNKAQGGAVFRFSLPIKEGVSK